MSASQKNLKVIFYNKVYHNQSDYSYPNLCKIFWKTHQKVGKIIHIVEYRNPIFSKI